MSLIDDSDYRLALNLIIQQLAQLQNKATLSFFDALKQRHQKTCLRSASQVSPSSQSKKPSSQHVNVDNNVELNFSTTMLLLERYKAAPRALKTLDQLFKQGTSRELEHIAKQVSWIKNNKIVLLAWGDAAYPMLLKEIAQPPPFLYLKGRVELLHYPQLAMVGARRATPIGLKTAYQLASQLAENNLLISSGMALGVDAACHRGVLDKQRPTLAVLGTGIDLVYPKRHASLADEIAENGLLVSEFALGSPPMRYHFPQRNRLLSGLSLGVLVVEAGLKSGSLITAKFALEQGREVFAVPGSVHNDMAQGCHALLKDGAHLVARTEDIMQVLEQSSIAGIQMRALLSRIDEDYSADENEEEQKQENLSEERCERGLPDQLTHLSLGVISGFKSVDRGAASTHTNLYGEPLLKYSTKSLDSTAHNDVSDSKLTNTVYALIEDQGTSLEELEQNCALDYSRLCACLLQLECERKILVEMGLYFKI